MGRKRNSKTLNPEILKIRLGELESFCRGELYGQFSTVPITPARAVSYINNPYAMPEDVVLLLALIEGKPVAFRSLFADVINVENRKVRFGWCSGSWVDSGFRRRGLSQLLLKEAYNDWNGRLMFTNYAPESESLYLKTGWFKPVHQFAGIRGYLFPETARLFPNIKGNPVVKRLFTLADFLVARLSRVRVFFYTYRKDADISFMVMEHPDKECLKFIEHYNQKFLFDRKSKGISWILNFPWISEMNRQYEQKYPFSACSGSFYYQTVKVIRKDILEGVCMFSVRDGHLKTLFFWLPSHLENDFAGFLKYYTIKNRLQMITVYHQGIARELAEKKYPFLLLRKFGQKVYSSFDTDTTESYIIQDGDGDRAFT